MSRSIKHILIACDAFKDAATSLEVCAAIERGITRASKTMKTTIFPMADGGEGTAEVLQYHLGGKRVGIRVKDPLWRDRDTGYYISEDGLTAFIAMADASGLEHLTNLERNPLHTTTYGTGQMIAHAMDLGVGRILLGIGGSATNDCGIGMASALGWRFLDDSGQELEPVGASLHRVRRIDRSGARSLDNCRVVVMCDVDNVLYGTTGAAHVYAAQKGATREVILELDAGLRHFAEVLEDALDLTLAQVPGSGAAGGLGAGSMAFLQGRLEAGVEVLMRFTGFDNALKRTDIVITGEGHLDGQTSSGKVIAGICQHAAHYVVPVWAMCGRISATMEQISKLGLEGALSISPGTVSLDEAIHATEDNLERAAWSWAQSIRIRGSTG